MWSYLKSLSHLFYPKNCITCSNTLSKHEESLCIVCLQKLPFTNFHLNHENPLQKKYWGRMDVQSLDSLLYFEKGSITQELLHQLKYRGKQEVGIKLAEILIQKYKDQKKTIPFDAIVSIPLHTKKEKRRGYNQCTTFCNTLSYAWNIPYLKNDLKRNIDNITQTGKTRIDRWENVANIFSVDANHSLSNKHVLLVDDVLTTGATIEACGQTILNTPNTKLSILTMACKV